MLRVNGNAMVFAIRQQGQTDAAFQLLTSKDGARVYLRGNLSAAGGRDANGNTQYTRGLMFTAFGQLAQDIVSAGSGARIALWDAEVQDWSYKDQSGLFHPGTMVIINSGEVLAAGKGGTMPVRQPRPQAQAAPVQQPQPAQFGTFQQAAPMQQAMPNGFMPAGNNVPFNNGMNTPVQQAAPMQQQPQATPAPQATQFNVQNANAWEAFGLK
jgi:hypothetical protein